MPCVAIMGRPPLSGVHVCILFLVLGGVVHGQDGDDFSGEREDNITTTNSSTVQTSSGNETDDFGDEGSGAPTSSFATSPTNRRHEDRHSAQGEGSSPTPTFSEFHTGVHHNPQAPTQPSSGVPANSGTCPGIHALAEQVKMLFGDPSTPTTPELRFATCTGVAQIGMTIGLPPTDTSTATSSSSEAAFLQMLAPAFQTFSLLSASLLAQGQAFVDSTNCSLISEGLDDDKATNDTHHLIKEAERNCLQAKLLLTFQLNEGRKQCSLDTPKSTDSPSSTQTADAASAFNQLLSCFAVANHIGASAFAFGASPPFSAECNSIQALDIDRCRQSAELAGTLQKVSSLSCFLKTLNTTSFTLLPIAFLSNELRKSTFHDSASPAHFIQYVLQFFPKLICSELCKNCTLRQPLLQTLLDSKTCQDIKMTIDLVQQALSFDESHSRPIINFLQGLSISCVSRMSHITRNIPQSSPTQKHMCFDNKCPLPLKATSNADHWVPSDILKEDLQGSLTSFFPNTRPLHNFSIPCGLACVYNTLTEEDSDKLDIQALVQGSISVFGAAVALLAFAVNYRKITAIPLRLLVILNIGGLLTSVTLLVAIPMKRKIACHDDDTLRLREPTGFNGCAIVMSIAIFWSMCMTFLSTSINHAWLELVKKLSNPSRLPSKSTDRKYMAAYTIGSFLISAIFTILALSRQDVTGVLMHNGCVFSHKSMLYYMTAPSAFGTAVSLYCLCAGLVKLRRTFSASKNVTRYSVSSVDVDQALRKQIKRLLAYVIVVLTLIIFNTYFQIASYFEGERLNDEFKDYFGCLLFSCNPGRDCPEYPKTKTELIALTTLFFNLTLMVMATCGWVMEWRYWKTHWPFSSVDRYLSRLQSSSSSARGNKKSSKVQVSPIKNPSQYAA